MARSISDAPEEENKPDPVDMEKLADMLYSVFLAVQDLTQKVDEQAEQLKRVNGL
jgi:hypothetical protein